MAFLGVPPNECAMALGATKVFYAYSPGEELDNVLESHLSLLRRRGIIHEWHAGKLEPEVTENGLSEIN